METQLFIVVVLIILVGCALTLAGSGIGFYLRWRDGRARQNQMDRIIRRIERQERRA